MSDRAYLFMIGSFILLSLYFEIHIMIYLLVVVMLFEGATGYTITRLTQNIRKVNLDTGLLNLETIPKFNFDAFRALRILFAIVMMASYVAVHVYKFEMVWFFPWFFGFALVGAGISSVCPVFLGMRWLGFR